MSKNVETILSVFAVACLTMLIIAKIFNFWNIGSDFMDKAEKKQRIWQHLSMKPITQNMMEL